jgi:hypothetical protein
MSMPPFCGTGVKRTLTRAARIPALQTARRWLGRAGTRTGARRWYVYDKLGLMIYEHREWCPKMVQQAGADAPSAQGQLTSMKHQLR